MQNLQSLAARLARAGLPPLFAIAAALGVGRPASAENVVQQGFTRNAPDVVTAIVVTDQVMPLSAWNFTCVQLGVPHTPMPGRVASDPIGGLIYHQGGWGVFAGQYYIVTSYRNGAVWNQAIR